MRAPMNGWASSARKTRRAAGMTTGKVESKPGAGHGDEQESAQVHQLRQLVGRLEDLAQDMEKSGTLP